MKQAGFERRNPNPGSRIGTKRGRLACYSFIAYDKYGTPYRKWHPEIDRFSKQDQKSLKGMTKV